jgi:hypothetical protein
MLCSCSDQILDFIRVNSKQNPKTNLFIFVTSGFRCKADEICILLEYKAALSGTTLPMFQDNISVPPSRVRKSKKRSLSS